MKRPGSGPGSTPSLPVKGGDRATLHGTTGRQHRRLPGRDGTASQQELPGSAAREASRPQGRARQAGDRLRPAWRCRVRLWRAAAGDRRGSHPDLRASHHGQLGRLPEHGRGLDRSGGRASLRRARQPQHPPRARRAAVQPAASALGVRVPAHLRRLPEPDRALVESAALAGAEGPPFRSLGRDRGGRRSRHGLLERSPASIHLGSSTASSAVAPPRDRGRPKSHTDLADAPLSRAKEQGRNHYQFYTDDMNATAFERLMLESRLRKALEQDEFVIYYQPKIGLADGAVVGVEALLRWFHPDLGLVPPAEFIPLAEETGLIVDIGAWVLKTACAQVRRWQRMGHGRLELAVNISARQFQEKNLVATIAAAVEESGMQAGLIELELTESVIMRDAPEAARRLKELTALGIRLAIDDFGTGYSSLGYLKAFPISTLKIDRSFVRDIDRDPNSAALAQAIIALASSLKLKVVAEGVETREQLEQLRACGCQELQGFIFSKPLPPEELLARLEQGTKLQL